MYNKDLTESVRLRLTDEDMKFLSEVSEERCVSISALIRQIIGDYRRGYHILTLMENEAKKEAGKEAKTFENLMDKALSDTVERMVDVHGDTKTNQHHKL